MSASKPQLGMIIQYAFAWNQADSSNSNKARPAMIIMALGDGRVLVLPISHSPPMTGQDTIEIPHNLKSSLGLDDAPQWIHFNNPNIFLHGWVLM